MPASFYILAALTLASAFAAMTLRNLVHCALCLAGAFIGMAGLFLQLDAAFAAFAQILVYVGAVAILIVFAILLTRNSEEQPGQRATSLLPSLAITGLLAGTFVAMIASTSLLEPLVQTVQPAVADLGTLLMTTHIVPLQITGILLTAALIGAVIIALKEPAEPKQ